MAPHSLTTEIREFASGFGWNSREGNSMRSGRRATYGFPPDDAASRSHSVPLLQVMTIRPPTRLKVPFNPHASISVLDTSRPLGKVVPCSFWKS